MSSLPPEPRTSPILSWSRFCRALTTSLLLFIAPVPLHAQLFPAIFARSEKGSATPPHPAVARIIVPEKDGVSFGSGTLIDVRDNVGLVVTNWHVVNEAGGGINVVFPDGFQSPARVLKTDKDWDLAALAIWKPTAAPVPISTTVPRPGDPLAIGGYGSGDWRLAYGKCTQYVAPAENLPYEMVELSAEARQGDSGGPIFNARGELAGVLFGASRGTTSGSYAGRVRQFLEPILAGGVNETPPASQLAANPGGANSLPAHQTVAAGEPLSNRAAGQTLKPSPDVLKPPAAVNSLVSDYIPNESAAEALRTVEEKNQQGTVAESSLPPDESIAPRNTAGNAFDHDPQFNTRTGPNGLEAVERRDLSEQGLVYTPLPPRGRSSVGIATTMHGPVTSNGSHDPHANLWQQLAGTTLFEQAKSVLAVLGLLTIVYRFMGRESNDGDGEE